ncbi:competence protein [unidentified eubacterium SCB49]|nr:competence protein [unidentified eubacterium SCB49]
MKFINYPIIKFSFCLTVGILCAHYFGDHFKAPLYLLGILLVTIAILWGMARKKMFQNSFFGIVTYLTFITIGYINYQYRLPQNIPNHYTTIASTDSLQFIELKITKELKPDNYNHKYIATVRALNSKTTTGDILLLLQKDTLRQALQLDDILLLNKNIEAIRAPQNPHQFDYAAYMRTLGIYGQIRSIPSEILTHKKGATTIIGFAEGIRNHIISKLKQSSIGKEERAIVQALLLGQKNEISKETFDAYAAAGAIHILAVSGLHVGIIYLILLTITFPLLRIKYGKQIQSIFIVLCLISFAIITGLSPSVTRAVTMFSFLALAGLLNRQTSTINTLSLSYLALLLVNPLWIFHVGFQLSYLAVFFIIWLQPLLRDLLTSRNYFIRKIWGIVTVTITAQLGLLPLSLYYFHQFPGLFIITNVVILPFLGLLLGAGIIIIFLALINALPEGLANIFGRIIKALNDFIAWVAGQEDFLFQDIPFSIFKVFGTYFVIFAVVLLWKQLCFKRIVLALSSIIVFISVFSFDKWKSTDSELVIFQKSRTTLIGVKQSQELVVFSSDTLQDLFKSYPLKSYITEQNTGRLHQKETPSYFIYNNKHIVVIDSIGAYPKLNNIDILLMTESPKIHFERVLDSLQPKQVIADGSNYTTYVNRWQASCIKRKIPFHHTGKKGAFILK